MEHKYECGDKVTVKNGEDTRPDPIGWCPSMGNLIGQTVTIKRIVFDEEKICYRINGCPSNYLYDEDWLVPVKPIELNISVRR